jgi:hypothetical protein
MAYSDLKGLAVSTSSSEALTRTSAGSISFSAGAAARWTP